MSEARKTAIGELPDFAEPFCPADIVRHWAETAPSAPALTCGVATTTWERLYDRSRRVANALTQLGVRAGDHVLFVDQNGVWFFEAFFGCSMVGAVFGAVNPRLTTAEQALVVDDAQARVVLAGPAFHPALDLRRAEFPTVEHLVGGEHYEQLLASVESIDPQRTPQSGEIVQLGYTSGTTGRPKGVRRTNEALGEFIPFVGEHFGADADSSYLIVLPVAHVGGSTWTLGGLARGIPCALVRDETGLEVLELVERHRVTALQVVPTIIEMWVDLLEAGVDIDVSSLRVIGYGGAPMAISLLERAQRVLPGELLHIYGSTESLMLTVLSPDDHRDPTKNEFLKSAGRATNGVELRVVDPSTGAGVPDGTTGEIRYKSKTGFAGYWRRPEENSAVRVDGWTRSSDLGYLRDGYLFVVDRTNSMIITGGENVVPVEVESVLFEHPKLIDAAVIGVPSARWGEVVSAVVVPGPGADVSEEEVIEFARTRLASFKRPRHVFFAETLERDPLGKVNRKRLRELYTPKVADFVDH